MGITIGANCLKWEWSYGIIVQVGVFWMGVVRVGDANVGIVSVGSLPG